MKLWKKGLACLLTAALTLAVLTGCSGLGMIGTVQEDTDAAKKLMEQVNPALQYDDQLEYAAQRIADWLIGEPMQLGASEGQLVRKVPLSANDDGLGYGQRLHCGRRRAVGGQHRVDGHDQR